MNWSAYYRLGRLDKLTGVFLLFIPEAWALWITQEGHPSLRWLLLFFVGSFFMRTAGCVINDMVDRKIDIEVLRTQKRPLASQELSMRQAFVFLIFLLVPSLYLFLQLPSISIFYALIAIVIVILYPFSKRWLSVPQSVLGIAFSMGIPMVYALQNDFNSSMYLLLAINWLWILAYDTQYAMVDKQDDIRIGMHSATIFFQDYSREATFILLGFSHGLWLILAKWQHFSSFFYVVWFLSTGCFWYQYILLKEPTAKNCFQAFSSHVWYGIMLWLALILAYH